MSDKMKKSTGGKLLIRSGGLALSLPIVLLLGGILMMINSLLTVIIIGGLITGHTVVVPYVGWLAIFLALGVWTMLVLFRAVFRYTGGIGKLWGRMRGIQEERERVERLMEQQNSSEELDVDIVQDSEADAKQQSL